MIDDSFDWKKQNMFLYWATYILTLLGIFSINRAVGDAFFIFIILFATTAGFLGSWIEIYKKYISNRYAIWVFNILVILIVIRVFPFAADANFIRRCLIALILLNLINSFTINAGRELAISQIISTVLIIFAPTLMLEGFLNFIFLFGLSFFLWILILNFSLRARLSKDCEKILVINKTRRDFLKEVASGVTLIIFTIIAAIPILFILVRFQLPILLISPYFQSDNTVDVFMENQPAAINTNILAQRSKDDMHQPKWLILPGGTKRVFLHSAMPGKGNFGTVNLFKNKETQKKDNTLESSNMPGEQISSEGAANIKGLEADEQILLQALGEKSSQSSDGNEAATEVSENGIVTDGQKATQAINVEGMPSQGSSVSGKGRVPTVASGQAGDLQGSKLTVEEQVNQDASLKTAQKIHADKELKAESTVSSVTKIGQSTSTALSISSGSKKSNTQFTSSGSKEITASQDQIQGGPAGKNRSSPEWMDAPSGFNIVGASGANQEKMEERLYGVADSLWSFGRLSLFLLLLFIILDYLLSKIKKYIRDMRLKFMALKDPQGFIIKAYSYICQSLSISVSPRLSYMTAEEYLHVVKYNVNDIGPWFEAFTDKFQEAAYSNHIIKSDDALGLYDIYRSINNYLWQRKFTFAYISKKTKERYNQLISRFINR